MGWHIESGGDMGGGGGRYWMWNSQIVDQEGKKNLDCKKSK